MAKELPYFQFEPAEYLTKDISFCSLSAQGLFINICAFYWQRECNLTKAQVLRRFNYPDVLKELIDESIIKADENDNIIISFLLTQYEEIIEKKSNDSEKGKIGNLKRWHKSIYDKFIKKELSLNEALAIAKESGCDSLAIAKTSHIREDKIKKDEIKEDNNKALPFSFFNSMIKYGFDKNLVSEWIKVRKNKKLTNTETSFKNFIKEVEKTNDDINNVLTECIVKSWGGFKSEWYKKDSLLNSIEKKKYEVSNAFGKEVVFLTDLEFAEKSKQNFNTYKLLN